MMSARRTTAGALVALLALAGCGTPADDFGAPGFPAVSDSELTGVEAMAGWRQQVGVAGAPNDRLQPAVAEGRVFVADGGGDVYAFQAEDGAPIWRRSLDAPLSGGPAASDELVVIGSRDGRVFGLSAEDGEIRWEAEVSSEVLAPADIGQGVVAVRISDGRLLLLEADSGERRFAYDRDVPALSLRGHSAPVLVGGGVVAGFDDGRLAALRLDEGEVAWEVSAGVAQGRTELERMVDVDADPVVDGTDVFAASYQGRLAAFDLRSGDTDWSRDVSVHAGLTVDRERLYATDDRGRIWSMDRATGGSVWRQDALAEVEPTAPVRFGEHLVVGAADGNLYWLALDDGSVLDRREVGDSRLAVAPVVAGVRIYALSLGGQLATWHLPD